MADVRRFVCQGCGTVVSVLFGRSVICSCGEKSNAELAAWTPPGFEYHLGRHAKVVRRLSDGELCISIGDNEYVMSVSEANELAGMINAVRRSPETSAPTTPARP